MHRNDQDDPNADPNDNFVGWAIVRVKAEKDKRIVTQIRFTQVTGHAKHNDDLIDTKDEELGHGWLTLTPNEDLADGQYALTPIFRVGNTFANSVYAFGIDPNAPEAEGAIKPDPDAESKVQ